MQVENLIWGNTEYKKYCELDYGNDEDQAPVCRRPESPLNLFFTYDEETATYSEQKRQSVAKGVEEIKDVSN